MVHVTTSQSSQFLHCRWLERDSLFLRFVWSGDETGSAPWVLPLRVPLLRSSSDSPNRRFDSLDHTPQHPIPVNSLAIFSLSFYVNLIEFSSSVLFRCSGFVRVLCGLHAWHLESFFSVDLLGAVFASLLLRYHNLITSSKHHLPGWTGLHSSRLTGCTTTISSVPLWFMSQNCDVDIVFLSSALMSQNIYWNAIVLFLKALLLHFIFSCCCAFLGQDIHNFLC